MYCNEWNNVQDELWGFYSMSRWNCERLVQCVIPPSHCTNPSKYHQHTVQCVGGTVRFFLQCVGGIVREFCTVCRWYCEGFAQCVGGIVRVLHSVLVVL